MKNYYSFILISTLILMMNACSENEDGGSTPVNTVPIAKAGIDQNIHTGTQTTLNGSDSTDADGNTLTYSWKFINKPTTSGVTLSKADTVNPSFTSDVDGLYTLTLVVNDGAIDSKADEIVITSTTANAAPVAQAGKNQKVHETDTVTLHGQGTDADGDSLRYQWSLLNAPQGSTVTLSDPTIANPTFSADLEGPYSFSLVVNDGAVSSHSSQVLITAYKKEFITTWQTDVDKKITIKVNGETGTYHVDWGDGGTDNVSTDITHTYNIQGTYTVTISGDFSRIFFKNSSIEAKKILSIDNWGATKWSTMDSAFEGCSNLVIKAEDIPDLKRVTNMYAMFRYATAINQPIGDWDTSTIENMSRMFQGATAFNQSLNDWNTSNVTSMFWMFSTATSFNQPLGKWDTKNLTNTYGMFNGARLFNQAITHWKTGNVTTTAFMFNDALTFNQPINDWNVSNVTNMSSMFNGAESFNQRIGSWDISNVQQMDNMLLDTPLNISNYYDLLTEWGQQTLQNNVKLDANICQYYAGGAAENNITHIINTYNWTINGTAPILLAPKPIAPINLNILVDQDGTHLRWTDMSNNEISFILETKLESELVWSAPKYYPIDTDYIFFNSNTTNGQTRQFRVHSYNDVSGSSAYLNGSHTY